MVSVLCFSPVVCEEGEIIDSSFYHKECVFVRILIISVMHNQVHLTESKGEGVVLLNTSRALHPVHRLKFHRALAFLQVAEWTQCPWVPRDPPKSFSAALFAAAGAAQGHRGETGAVGGQCSLHTSTAASWLLVVSVSLLALKSALPLNVFPSKALCVLTGCFN